MPRKKKQIRRNLSYFFLRALDRWCTTGLEYGYGIHGVQSDLMSHGKIKGGFGQGTLEILGLFQRSQSYWNPDPL